MWKADDWWPWVDYRNLKIIIFVICITNLVLLPTIVMINIVLLTIVIINIVLPTIVIINILWLRALRRIQKVEVLPYDVCRYQLNLKLKGWLWLNKGCEEDKFSSNTKRPQIHQIKINDLADLFFYLHFLCPTELLGI